MRPPFESFKNPICKGSVVLNTACGNCERCAWEEQELARLRAELPSEPPVAGPQLVITLTVDPLNLVHLSCSGKDSNFEAIAAAAGDVFAMDLREALRRCVPTPSQAVRA